MLGIIPFFLSVFVIYAEAAVLDKQGNLMPETKEILHIIADNVDKMQFSSDVGKPSKEKIQAISNMRELHDFLQKYFLRPQGKERQDLSSANFYQGLFGQISGVDQDKLMKLFKSLGFIDQVLPEHSGFKYIVIHGSTIQNMRDRIKMLDYAVRNGVVAIAATTRIIIADGYRPAFPEEKIPAAIEYPSPYDRNPSWKLLDNSTLPDNEIELARVAWNQLDLCPALRNKEPFFTDTPVTGPETRANTETTMKTWVEKFEPTSLDLILSVSSNPYTFYQEAQVLAAIYKWRKVHGNCESLAPAMTIQENSRVNDLGKLFDTAARETHVKLKYLPEDLLGQSADEL